MKYKFMLYALFDYYCPNSYEYLLKINLSKTLAVIDFKKEINKEIFKHHIFNLTPWSGCHLLWIID